MIITLCFDYYDEKSGMIAKRNLLFQGNREIHAINHNTNRDMANITICSTTIPGADLDRVTQVPEPGEIP